MAYQRQRTETERLVDVMLSLVVMDLASDTGFVGDRLKCMKLLFLSEYDLFRKGIKALSMTFHRGKYGPMSVHAYDAWAHLASAGMVFEPEGDEPFDVLESGHEFARSFASDVLSVGMNTVIADHLKSVADQYSGLSKSKVLDSVYAMNVPTLEHPSPRKIAEIAQNETFTAPIDDREAAVIIGIPEEWLCSMSVEFNETNRALMSRAVQDLQCGRVVAV